MTVNNPFQSLAARLNMWIIPLVTLIFIIVLATNYFLSRLLLEDYVADLAKTTSTSTVAKIEKLFNTVEANADSLAAVISSPEITKKQIHQIIKAFLKTNADIFGMAVALETSTLLHSVTDFSPYYYKNDYKNENKLVFSNLATENYDYKNQTWYSEAKKINAAIWSEPYVDTGGGNVLMATYSTPIYLSDSKAFAGIATADIELSWLDKIVKDIHIGETGFGFIVSKADIIIAHPDGSLNMKKLIDTLDHKIIPDNWQKYINSKSQSSSVYLHTPCRHQNGFCWVAIETLGNTGWKVIIVLPEQELIANINSLTIKISIIAATGLLLLLFVIILITSHLTRPLGKLAIATKEIGAGHLDTKLPQAVREDVIGALTNDFSSMRTALKAYITKIRETTAKQQKLESEIQIATDIQMSMLPGAGNVSLKQNSYQLFAYLKPARSVGGDLYYYQQTGEQLHFIIGDVSDKGVPAALFMAKAVTLYTRALRDRLSPGQTFNTMNEVLVQNNDACMFVTALCGSINLHTGSIVMANAGHMNPIIEASENTEAYEIKGATALGLMNCVDYPDIKFTLANKTSLIMYTDGISEAHDKNDNQYTDEKLLHFISNTDTSDTMETGNKIIKSVDDFASDTDQFDDITLLIIRYE